MIIESMCSSTVALNPHVLVFDQSTSLHYKLCPQTSQEVLGNIRRRPQTFWGHLWTSLETVSWQFAPWRMCRYEDKGGRPEGSGCSVWTSAGAHGSRTQAAFGINMDVHQAPCPLPPCLSLCAATVRCVPVNSINSMAATSSHAKVINKHPQMAHNDSLQSDTAVWRVSRPVVTAHSFVCLTVFSADSLSKLTDSESKTTLCFVSPPGTSSGTLNFTFILAGATSFLFWFFPLKMDNTSRHLKWVHLLN